jgi:hypothetical protein
VIRSARDTVERSKPCDDVVLSIGLSLPIEQATPGVSNNQFEPRRESPGSSRCGVMAAYKAGWRLVKPSVEHRPQHHQSRPPDLPRNG